jgi:hypothetical protein
MAKPLVETTQSKDKNVAKFIDTDKKDLYGQNNFNKKINVDKRSDKLNSELIKNPPNKM